MDLIGIILWPLKWVVELVLVGWHALFTLVGLPPADGITWVLSIIGLVIVLRSALIPLFVRQIKSQRKMMEIAPELRKVQEKYRGKKDQLSREAMSRETMALYKKHGTTPVSSCLPLLVQMPIFFALFSVLNDVQKIAKDPTFSGVGLLNNELTQEFYDAKLFGVASLHETLINAVETSNGVAITILVILVVLMIASQFFTQLQIISKNLSPEAKTGQAYQMQRIMLYILPLAFIFSGVFFPLGVVIYWFVSNLWTMVQQFIVIREMPTPGSEAAKAREERLARKGKAIDSSGKVVSMEKYQAEQQRLLEEAERARAAAPKRQQPVGKQRAKKQAPKQQGPKQPAPKQPGPGAQGQKRPSSGGAPKPADGSSSPDSPTTS
ncbi:MULTISPECIES: membrane protein insertase YidC [Microbacterium]|uniref:Membrane protein insertase YidC n=1 Tax=Microbacterium wangchenii TaxID=2541726 RepID=A0ABX5SZH7_9MICO|nr:MULTISPECIES: membrane protein insertase YidC [Microbacterium]MCK6066237.1 membrane protein insertase YidC [Microbacterium sp. EYE_512]QBR90508.1 membrane protein insertase YidC [Microbacterium wangchenii]TFV84684.1 membrane protein insertase YidC [Microbacterium sp. dk485]TXK14534.1 membrane protein insertase YidC [Microbacterium wangchenii]